MEHDKKSNFTYKFNYIFPGWINSLWNFSSCHHIKIWGCQGMNIKHLYKSLVAWSSSVNVIKKALYHEVTNFVDRLIQGWVNSWMDGQLAHWWRRRSQSCASDTFIWYALPSLLSRCCEVDSFVLLLFCHDLPHHRPRNNGGNWLWRL